jgi:hypothetical protein
LRRFCAGAQGRCFGPQFAEATVEMGVADAVGIALI